MTTWFTADLHFGHANIIEYENRGFASVDEMNRSIIDKWNGTVGEDDTVIIVGDFAMGKLRDTVPLANDLNGRLCLVPGNHDKCWAGRHKMSRSMYVDAGFMILPEEHSLLMSGVSVKLCHFPYAGESNRHFLDRYEDHRPVDKGDWLVHGHVHGAWRQKGRQINVGIDAWGGKLVSGKEITDTIAEGPQDLPKIEWST